ncbi:hypothetical protein ACHHYP_07305 [Achlya hypogyna]|uniref:Uncharacterized protein n=1 Tax=Achlya hypogyna TaxID=1202772 RepID=A0A1V9YR58_ACHHY|nr:hypothetical protein ACHHYP_07305 [Achlya hypogyna]
MTSPRKAPKRPPCFRSTLLKDLIRTNEAVQWTPETALDFLRHIFPASATMPALVARTHAFVFKAPDGSNNDEGGVLVAYKDLYHGALQYTADQTEALAAAKARLSSQLEATTQLDAEIAALEAALDAQRAAFHEKKCRKEIALFERRLELRTRQSASLIKAIDEKQDALLQMERLAKDENQRMRHEDFTYRLSVKKLKDNEGFLVRAAKEGDVKRRLRSTETSMGEMTRQIAILQQSLAATKPQAHALTTEIFAVRATRSELEAQLATVRRSIAEIQGRVMQYKEAHTPRPNWEQVARDVDATFKTHNRKCPTQKISTENLLKLQSSGDRVMYLAHAVQIIGLADDADAIDRERQILANLQAQMKKTIALIRFRE